MPTQTRFAGQACGGHLDAVSCLVINPTKADDKGHTGKAPLCIKNRISGGQNAACQPAIDATSVKSSGGSLYITMSHVCSLLPALCTPGWLSGTSTDCPRELTIHRLPCLGPNSATGPAGREHGPGNDASAPLLSALKLLVAVVPVRAASCTNCSVAPPDLWAPASPSGPSRRLKPPCGPSSAATNATNTLVGVAMYNCRIPHATDVVPAMGKLPMDSSCGCALNICTCRRYAKAR
eukprot:GHUV01042094.1.p1 GENE.GHUV01042094.1~~GHUV01042094.1.p1  ORF type:complete len:236 (+),score=31.61 GHUV01042094.1:595-1302(+)